MATLEYVTKDELKGVVVPIMGAFDSLAKMIDANHAELKEDISRLDAKMDAMEKRILEEIRNAKRP